HAEGDPAGAHVLVSLPDRDAEEGLIAAAAGRGVAVGGLGRHCAGPGPHRAGLVVGFAAPTRADLARALEVLTSALQHVLDPRR
ncbi:PLP-dependent aminotransferase family protein, partial [Geodermatophilus sp. DF01-2]